MSRRFVFVLFVAFVTLSAAGLTQAPPTRPFSPAIARDSTPALDMLPVRRVVLYKTGVGYFEHLGQVRNRQDVTIRFTSAQLDDVLKSLTTIDMGKGQITGISYNSVAPLDQRLGSLRLPLQERTTTIELLASLRGARLEVTTAGVTVEGRLLSVERRERRADGEIVAVDLFSIVTPAGDIRTFELSPALRFRILDGDLRQEVGRYLDLVGSSRERDVRSMVISTTGTGERPLFVSYVSEVPIWKSTYRLVLPDSGKPLLQGWAIVDNTTGEDWIGVELSLVAGAPQSFIQRISQPLYGSRPIVPLPRHALRAPQTHQATLERELETLPQSARLQPQPTRPGIAGAVSSGVVGGVVGGIAEVPAPPPLPAAPYAQAARDIQTAATTRDIGDLFEYRVSEPVTLRKNESALVPVLNAEVTAEKVSLWNRASGSGRPLCAVWLTNSSGLTLDGGSISIIDAETFAGEGLIEPLKAGERRLVSYGTDLGVLVSARHEHVPGRLVRLRIRDGILIQETEERASWEYRARNEHALPVTLVIEHRLQPGWSLAEGQRPAESTPDTKRFRLTVDAGAEASLVVREVKDGETRIAVSDVTDDLIADVAQSGVPSADLQRALGPTFEKRAHLAALERRAAALDDQQRRIAEDQERLRENMKALRGSREERQLLQRYARQLDDQENRLEALRREVTEVEVEAAAARAELSRLIEGLSFELEAGR